MPVMEKKKTQNNKPKYPSRDKLKYVYIPKDYWLVLEEMGEAEERSVSYLVKKAVGEYLERRGRLPPKPTKE